jgi:hypothetical protein
MQCGAIWFSRQCVVSIVVKMDSSDAAVGSDVVDSSDAAGLSHLICSGLVRCCGSDMKKMLS